MEPGGEILSENRQKSPKRLFKTAGFLLLLIVLLFFSGFFAWKNYHLERAIRQASPKRPLATPTTAILISPVETITEAEDIRPTVAVPTTGQAVTNPDPFPGWQNYQDSKNKFSLYYPAGFLIFTGPVPESDIPKTETVSLRSPEMIITINPKITNANNVSLVCTDTATCLEKLITATGQTRATVKTVSLNFLDADQTGFEYLSGEKFNRYFIFLEKDNAWVISLIIPEYLAAKSNNYNATFSQVLSTLKID